MRRLVLQANGIKMDANVGITKSLVVEPTVSNALGYREDTDISALKDVNIMSPVEMLTPGTARGDDPIRTAINHQ